MAAVWIGGVAEALRSSTVEGSAPEWLEERGEVYVSNERV